ncbi:DUF305 domain-containing protein [Antribacter gilvus]|uniref:DUF305 domain-containing protein n=1 Tax=Antribacter gilvus TaxID=2304675 RepID=UPI0019808E33|nr:DUF305 domain-containing protein [Antribacter gilvus]
MSKVAIAAALIPIAALVLTACAEIPTTGEAQPSSASSPISADTSDTVEFSSADVTFAQQMLAHHEQAVAMTDVILAKDGIAAEVTDFALKVKAVHEPEATQLTDWLIEWGASSPEVATQEGAASAALVAADGVDASRLFLDQMIAHHNRAIEMAKTERTEGVDTDAVFLARWIVESRASDILTMQRLLEAM